MRIRRQFTQTFRLAEAPFWDAAAQTLYWVDITARRVYRWREGAPEAQSWLLPEPVCAAIPCDDGALLVALASTTAFLNVDDGSLAPWVEVEPRASGNRANEAACDRQGRVWLGTMYDNVAADGRRLPMDRRSGALYSIDADGSTRRWAEHVSISNTLAWSPDGATLYFADSLDNRIDAYTLDLQTGLPLSRRTFAAGGPGGPDGSAIDAEGCLWNARWGASCLIRYRPDGRVDCEVPLPALRPTSCAFGGADLKTLFVTTDGEFDEAGASDGALLAIELQVPGLPGRRFAGRC